MADYEYRHLYLPRGTDRETAHTALVIHARYGEWELARSRLYSDGSRRILLRRAPGSQEASYFPT
ncbi:MAG: DUF5703 family protein [Mycobacteriales bacterium]